MRILVINTVRFKLNGISAVIMNYYKAMDKKEKQMDFVAIDEPSDEYKKMFQQYGINCYVVNKSNIIKYVNRLTTVARQGNYDIAHVHGNSANMAIELFACWAAGIKIRIAHSHNTSSLHPLTHKLLYPLFSILYTDGFACGYDAGKWLFHNKPFVVIKNGIDLKGYQFNRSVRAEYRKRINSENRTIIGHIGNFIEQKNHTFLLDVFAELVKIRKDYLLLLISDGYLLGVMQEKVHSLGLDDCVLFLGKTTEVQKYLQAMDIFVLPSLHEGLPVVLVEAQATGLPCIVSDAVSHEADLTKSIKFLNIYDATQWARIIDEEAQHLNNRNRCEIYKKWQDVIAEKGYDITYNANYMKALYEKYCQSRKK